MNKTDRWLTNGMLVILLAFTIGTHVKVSQIGTQVTELGARVILLEQNSAVYAQGMATLKIQQELTRERLKALEREVAQLRH